MPYCTKCGRQLQEGEICGCTAANTQQTAQPQNNFGSAPQQPYQNYQSQPAPQGFAPNGYPQGYPNQYYGQPMPPQKKSKTWILAIIIPVSIAILLILGILAAILVPAMLGYTKKSKLSSSNSFASSVSKAATTAIIELDEEGKKVTGKYIICSNEKDNVAVPFDIADFNEKFTRYIDNEKLEKYEYFIVVINGVAQYTAVSEDWTNKKKLVGTYPSSTIDGTRLYSADGNYSLSTDRKTLDYLYWDAYDKVFNK